MTTALDCVEVRATGDTDFEREAGLEILVETARLWMSLGHHDADGRFHFDGVTGPDEYTAIVNDNVYTNVMARLNLEGAAAAARRHPDVAQGLGVSAKRPVPTVVPRSDEAARLGSAPGHASTRDT